MKPTARSAEPEPNTTRSGVLHCSDRRPWSASDDATLCRIFSNRPSATVARQLGRTVAAVNARAYGHGLVKSEAYLASAAAGRTDGSRGVATRFRAGHPPANKGLRRPGWAPGRMRETQFKKGERRGIAVQLYQPIGAERISKDGYRQRKVNDDLPLQARWRGVHLIMWEQAHGPVPPGHAIAFRNGDKTEIRLENLECVSRIEMMARNCVHTLPEPLVKTIQLLGALKRQINRRTERAAHD